jgi:hypothetical protein
MKAATITQLKKELETYTHARLIEVLITTAKYKIENKELLSYVVFDADDPYSYVQDIKLEISTAFDEIHNASFYLALKRLRKILRTIQKYAKYMGDKEKEIELLTHFCEQMVQHGFLKHRYKSMVVIFGRVLDKIEKLIPAIHDDLQYDYRNKLEAFEQVL